MSRCCCHTARTGGRLLAWVLTLSALGSMSACRRPPDPLPVAKRPVEMLDYLKPERIGNAFSQPPWIAHVSAVDLDRDGLTDIIASEAQESRLLWFRQTAPGLFSETTLASDLPALVRAEPCDIDQDGDTDLLVACMGVVFPNNDRIGSVVILENNGRQEFTPHVILDKTARVTDVRTADFDGDGHLDLALGQFGYDQGEVRWMRRTGPWTFEPHTLLNLAGTINVCVADFNGDGLPDIAAQISQQFEEIYVFENRRGGTFERKRVWGSTNEDYGSSGMIACDLNQDGRVDLVFTNGDGFGPATLPGPRPWHGVHWLENTGSGFRNHRVGDHSGAYSPVAVDLDQDGAIDIVTVAAYVDRDNQGRRFASLVWFRNDGHQRFDRRILAYAPKDIVTLTSGDFDGSGRPSLVTGGFYVFAPYENMERILLWRR